MSELTSLPEVEQEVLTNDLLVENTQDEKPLSKRDYEMAVKRANAQREFQLKQNKKMVEELNIEVAYWQAQVDLLRLRYEKMDYTLKNMDLEPRYLQAMEEQKTKEEQSQILS